MPAKENGERDRPEVEVVNVEWARLVATRGDDGRPRWNLHFSGDGARAFAGLAYSMNEPQAWRLLLVLVKFLAGGYSPGVFSQSESRSDTPASPSVS